MDVGVNGKRICMIYKSLMDVYHVQVNLDKHKCKRKRYKWIFVNNWSTS
jgi:hypothetical protein